MKKRYELFENLKNKKERLEEFYLDTHKSLEFNRFEFLEQEFEIIVHRPLLILFHLILVKDFN